MQIQNDRLAPCHISPCLDILSPDTGFGLSERIIGVESVIFLKKQFEFLRPVLQSLLPQNKQLPVLEKLYKEVRIEIQSNLLQRTIKKLGYRKVSVVTIYISKD